MGCGVLRVCGDNGSDSWFLYAGRGRQIELVASDFGDLAGGFGAGLGGDTPIDSQGTLQACSS